MDPEFADLVPLFVEEARDRIERLATFVPQLEADSQAKVEVKRELHTLKGAGRMLRIAPLAELCHAAEEVLQVAPPGTIGLLTEVVDQLSRMVDTVAHGSDPEHDAELMARLAGSGDGAEVPAAAVAKDGKDSKKTEAAPEPEEVQEAAVEAEPAAPEPEPATTEKPAAAAPSKRGAGGDIRVDTGALDAVAERATQVRIMALAGRQVVERIYELARLAEEGLHEPQPTQVLAVLSTMLRRVAVELEGGQRRLIRASEEQLDRMLSLQLQPLRGSLHLLARYARELARSLGRDVDVELEGEETRLDRRITRELEDALLHLVRNAVDHGIEPPDVREAKGKPRAGRLHLRALADGPRVRLSLQDDGGGIDTVKVLERAVAVGLVDAASATTMGREEALRLIFAPGFSTRKEVSEVSGRGVGLDVVASSANRVGGEVFLDTDLGRGTTITLEVPVARRGEAVMLLRVGQLRLALPSSVVRRATRLDPEMIVERDGRTMARFPDRLVPFVPLARLYAQPAVDYQLLLEGAVSGQALAVAVDDVEGEQEILVRPMTRKVAADRLLEGVALLASGEPVGVLAPGVLAQREYLRALPVARERIVIKKVRVLLVDDSLVTREMERRLLEDAGFQVSAAGDAVEALSLLSERSFDCVVTDIEMPGMDGFELTAQLRAMEHFAHLPIIVVSTRDRPEDRLRGLKVGADAYLTKQSLDAGELVDLVRRLSGN
ncbi:MAG TPA: response regulator [Thermoanaerobaculia bacterium]|nr:response regulator [Thermoanaerobaculia bacterium]